MTLRPCRCGQIPQITERMVKEIHVIRVKCACGEHGAALLYTKPKDRARMIQVAADGWNLGV